MKTLWQHEETGRIVWHESPGKRWYRCPQIFADSIADILFDIANAEPVNGNNLAQMRVLLAAEELRAVPPNAALTGGEAVRVEGTVIRGDEKC